MKKREHVSKIMTANPITVNTSNSVNDIAQIFKKENIRHIPVVSGEKLVGMVSKTDMDRISFVIDSEEKVNTQVYNNLSIEQIMTEQLDVVQSSDEIRSAAQMLSIGNYHALPVLNGDKLEGIVTSTDVINYLLEQY